MGVSVLIIGLVVAVCSIFLFKDNSYGVIKETVSTIKNGTIETMNCKFESGNLFSINRINFKDNSNSYYKAVIPIKGDNMKIKYMNDHVNRLQTVSYDIDNVPFETLILSTTKETYLISVPAVYENDFFNKTLTRVTDEEKAINIEKTNSGYEVTMEFFENPDFIAEYWYMKINEIFQNEEFEERYFQALHYNFVDGMRWSYDGYYYPTPYNYVPTGEGVLYSNPANFVGAAWLRNKDENIALDLAYLMTTVCINNQNELGFFPTPPESEWLKTDFNIGASFYDTRFNTDFARNLVDAYSFYGEYKFIEPVLKYAEFFLDFAENNNYITSDTGILVEDYWQIEENEKTHVSLNHHLAELNFLYELNEIMPDEKYLDMAKRMLQGVIDTEEQWVKDNGDLEYALYYTKDTNYMVDYPTLTYNDLFDTKEILKNQFDETNSTVEYLMSVKKKWIDEKGITGYKE